MAADGSVHPRRLARQLAAERIRQAIETGASEQGLDEAPSCPQASRARRIMHRAWACIGRGRCTEAARKRRAFWHFMCVSTAFRPRFTCLSCI
eukprot:6148540-Pleurochrysis_carterae.AAC.2